MIKKILSLILSVCIICSIISCIPNTVVAAKEVSVLGDNFETYYCSLSDKGATIERVHTSNDLFMGATRKLVIPENVDGYPVTRINATEEKNTNAANIIDKIYIPNSVKTIRGTAFENLSGLKEIVYAGTKEEWRKIYISDFFETEQHMIGYLDTYYVPWQDFTIWKESISNVVITFAEDDSTTQNGTYDKGILDSSVSEVSVTVNGTKVQFDQQPIIENGRTLVPLRAIFEALDATVDWDNDTRTVISTKNNITITLSIGSTILFVNGIQKTLDVPAQLINGRTLVPVRAIGESFDCDVDWNDKTRTVIITTHEDSNSKNHSDSKTEHAYISADDVIKYSKEWIGTPYTEADCSYFVCKVFEKCGIDLWEHRTTLTTSTVDKGIAKQVGSSLEELASIGKVGDLVHFPGHIAIYIGNGQVIHSTTNNGVVISTLSSSSYWGGTGKKVDRIVRLNVLADN